jgi:hypothetical protein
MRAYFIKFRDYSWFEHFKLKKRTIFHSWIELFYLAVQASYLKDKVIFSMNQQVLIISNATLMLQIARAVILDFLFITEAFFYH